LAENYITQNEPEFCGLGSLSMVLNALHIDPGKKWKGPWRWFSQENLGCCKPIASIKEQGTTMSEIAMLGRCNGAVVELVNSSDASEEKFRQAIKAVTRKRSSNEPRKLMIINYSRKTLEQTGSGHFSPIGAYHEGSDSALVLDVAKFKHPPYWAPVKLLYQSLLESGTSGEERGYLILSPNKDTVTEATLPLVLENEGRSEAVATSICWGSAVSTYAQIVSNLVVSRKLHHDGVGDFDQLISSLFSDGTNSGTAKWRIGKLRIQAAGIEQMKRISKELESTPLNLKIQTIGKG
jgi:hypothetical protein